MLKSISEESLLPLIVILIIAIILPLGLLLIMGKSDGEKEVRDTTKIDMYVSIKQIDGHEYIVNFQGGIIHKFNCKGCAK